MGFCRRCGDIVAEVRCKCGGTAVAPSVNFNKATADRQAPDPWSRTYVTRDRSSTIPSTSKTQLSPTKEAPNPVRKFPRPTTNTTSFPRSTLTDKVSSHIQSTVIQRPSSPLKNVTKSEDDQEPPSPPADIIADPHSSTLSKAYGSVLQPKETLDSFCCYFCSTPFPPDATIYPDPANLDGKTNFLCKSCFICNGGAKGDCASCRRPVTILASEGGFIENAGRIWHRRCFRCDGCFKDVSDSPMVDLLGRPTCESCFDTCLKRPMVSSPSPRRYGTPEKAEKRSNPGGMKGESRESSPTIDELHQRLGIRSRESSPVIERDRSRPITRESSPAVPDLTQRFADMSTSTDSPGLRSRLSEDTSFAISDGSPRRRYEKPRTPVSKSPAHHYSPSVKMDTSVTAELDRRFLFSSLSGSPSRRSTSPATSVSRESFTPSTPDLADFSDTNTTSSAPSTPPSNSPGQQDLFSPRSNASAETPKQSAKGTPLRLAMSDPSTPCAKCKKPLFRTQSAGRFVTVPEESAKALPPKSYHVDCFRCAVCDEPFEETKNGQAVFVRSSSGCCHIGCVTPERIVIRPLKTKSSSGSLATTPAKYGPPPKTAPPTQTSFPRFGVGTTCPGCHVSVSPMERGVVPGPQGSRWHASCLVCGGRGAGGARRDPSKPGCGKRLDSAAKTDGEGGVWCRECMLLIPSESSPAARQGSPIRPLTPSHTGNIFGRFPASNVRRMEGIAPQFTGTTTIARQFTGMSSMSALTTQFTGGGLSPTRQLSNRSPSPTKFLSSGMPARRPFPRPKSVIGARGKSVDEGRGMFLVRQLTGSGQPL